MYMSENSQFSYWEHSSFLAHFDVAIVGSGIVGLSAALHLVQTNPALKIVVLERGFLPTGASTKNAGFACFGSVSELLDELDTSTEQELLSVIELRWQGLQKLRKNVGDRNLDYQCHGGYEIFTKEDQSLAERCIEKITYLNSLVKGVIGEPDIYSVQNAKIAAFGLHGIDTLIENRCEGQIDTGKMMRALAAKVQAEGVLILNNCRLQRIIPDSNAVHLQTDQTTMSSSKVIIATNAFATEFFPELDMVPGRGQALVTEPIRELKLRGTFHYDKGYYYFRNIHDRILIGGGRNSDFRGEQTFDMAITQPIQNRLEELLNTTIVPGLNPKIEYRWSGIMAFGTQLQPIVQKVQDNVFCAVRCNGMGVAMGSAVGERVADLVLKDL